MRKLVALLALSTVGLVAAAGSTGSGDAPTEVWAIDQSNTTGTTSGGAIHIYEGTSLNGAAAESATSERIDLGGATQALCLAQTGAAPVRPHMIFFNAGQTHAILSFVVSGHVVFYDAETRDPIACLRTSVGAGGARQAHAAVPSLDGTHVVVANQNGKLLERIRTDYATNTFTWDGALDLASGVTPNGASRAAAGSSCPDPAAGACAGAEVKRRSKVVARIDMARSGGGRSVETPGYRMGARGGHRDPGASPRRESGSHHAGDAARAKAGPSDSIRRNARPRRSYGLSVDARSLTP